MSERTRKKVRLTLQHKIQITHTHTHTIVGTGLGLVAAQATAVAAAAATQTRRQAGNDVRRRGVYRHARRHGDHAPVWELEKADRVRLRHGGGRRKLA